FFFQAEDGIRDFHVTGVQTCALPISPAPGRDYYNRDNDFFSSHSIPALLGGLDRGAKERLTARIDALTALYTELSDIYQRDKGRSEERRVGRVCRSARAPHQRT